VLVREPFLPCKLYLLTSLAHLREILNHVGILKLLSNYVVIAPCNTNREQVNTPDCECMYYTECKGRIVSLYTYIYMYIFMGPCNVNQI